MQRPILPLLPLLAACLLPAVRGQAEKVDYNYDVRPIISGKCFQCHGPDEKARKAKLRLDVREEALKAHDDVRAIVPGRPEESELVVRITSHDPDEVMPPPKEDHALEAREVAILRQWVAEGAVYQEHWAFVKPVRPPVPRIDPSYEQSAVTHRLQDGSTGSRLSGNDPIVRNPIDSFVVSKLATLGMTPSPGANRYALIRRLSFDLTGLPPSLDEVDAFVADQSADAYERVVDRLLATPAFGERWAKMWLDLARYADSTGYGSDKFRLNIWPYRDWVINAFNRNLPYDQFTIEQLAGDLLPGATPEQLAATAFHRNTMTNVEGGIVPEEYRVAAVKDRVATTGQVWMGLTVACAQCHTHKFDPIPQKDYYAFFGIFNQTEDANREDEEPKMPLPTAEQLANSQRLQTEIGMLQSKLQNGTPELAAEQSAWEAEALQPVDWRTLAPAEASAKSGATFLQQPDGSLLVQGVRADVDTYAIKVRTDLAGITAFRLEALPDDTLPSHGPGRADNGNALLSELHVSAGPIGAAAPRGRFVRITLPGEGKSLALAEVQIFSKGDNLALRGVATQSSTDFGGDAGRAIDGQTNGDFFKGKSVSHTGVGKDPWWEVDLGIDADVDRMVIWNRTDSDLWRRLANFRITFLDANRQTVWEKTITDAPKTSLTVSPSGGHEVILRNASADFSQEGYPVADAIDGYLKSGWALSPELGKAHAAVFETATPLSLGAQDELTFTVHQDYGEHHTLGRFRLSATSHSPPVREVPGSIRAVLALEPSERDPKQQAELAAYFRPLSRTIAALEKQLGARRSELAAIKPVALPILRELAPERRRETHLLTKGNYLTPGAKVESGLLTQFASFMPQSEKVDRLTAARWLVHPENPLTARVAVNRFWSQLFGAGLVETEEDFGTQGTLPSHPQLLDWLAVTFMSPKNSDPANPGLGWDMKGLLRLIVTSATYRQSSRVSPEMLEKDARNRWLARAPRRRLEAEAVRDQALALSGLLSQKIGGKSVYPPQPDGLWKVAFNGGQNAYPTSQGEDRYRRGLYTFWRRTMPYPSMTTFDAPSRETCTVRRLPTNTPLQAFVTLNDPAFVECAQALARRIVHEGGTDSAARVKFALRLCLGQPPDEVQFQALTRLYEDEIERYAADPASAAKLGGAATGSPDQKESDAAMAAWTVVANVLLNLDAVLTKG